MGVNVITNRRGSVKERAARCEIEKLTPNCIFVDNKSNSKFSKRICSVKYISGYIPVSCYYRDKASVCGTAPVQMDFKSTT